MKLFKFLIVLFSVLTVFCFLSCGNDDGDKNQTADYKAVEEIIGVPDSGFINIPISLTGTVVPTDATNKNIVWSIRTQNGTNSVLNGNIITASSVGTGRVSVTAVIENGRTQTTPFTRNYNINLSEYVAVSLIKDVPSAGFAHQQLALSGTVEPENATYKTIVWTVKNAGTTNAAININRLASTAPGTVIVTASINNGTAIGTPHTQDFTIVIEEPSSPPPITAIDYVKGLGMAINIGNNLDAWGGETAWSNPMITRAYIIKLREFGYKTVRLPITWAGNMGDAPDYTIASAWMNRVQTIVDWIIAEEMYCIINIHHDGHGNDSRVWIQDAAKDYPNNAANANIVNDRFRIVWTQIANHFIDYSEYLIFEGMNEVGFDSIWNRYGGAGTPDTLARKTEAYRLLNMLNQTFVDTVRNTGSLNGYRFLLIPGYWTDISATCDAFFKMPSDTAADKLMISVHYYTPWNFVGNASSSSNTWGSTSQVNELNNLFNMMKTSFIDKGIPVILGEYNVIRARAETERIKWIAAVTQKCIDLGICPVLWCNGGHFGINQNHAGATSDTYSRFFHDMGDVLREGENSRMSTAMQSVWAQLNFP